MGLETQPVTTLEKGVVFYFEIDNRMPVSHKALKDRSNKQFVRAVILERGDIFSSDREVAAFALAASKRGLIQKLKKPL